MLKIQPKATFRAPVLIRVPGQAKPATVTFEFNFKGRDELASFFDSLGGDAENGIEPRKDADALAELVCGWSGVDEAFSPENLERLLNNYPSSGTAIFEAYTSEIYKAKEKN